MIFTYFVQILQLFKLTVMLTQGCGVDSHLKTTVTERL